MIEYIVRRLLWTIPVLLIISGITFLFMHAAPGGPWDADDAERGKEMPATMRKLLDQQFGLDKPLWRQFTSYLIGDFDAEGSFNCGAVCGNLGPSFKQRGKTVQGILFGAPTEEQSVLNSKFGYSLRMAIYALIFAVALGVPAGVIAALNQNKPIDYAVTFISNTGVAVPSLVMGILLIVVFSAWLRWVPVVASSWAGVAVWILPTFSLGLGTLARIARYMRASVLDIMRLDFIRTARAKGLQEQLVVWRHMFRNALIPLITILGPALAGLIVGGITIEFMFTFPGISGDFVRAIGNRDYSMIMGTTLLFAVLIVFANLMVDVLYGVVDPRIRIE